MSEFHNRLNYIYELLRDKNPKFGRKEFAVLCDITLTQANNYLAGRGIPPMLTLLKMAKKLDTNVSWLSGESELLYDSHKELYPYVRDLDVEATRQVKLFINELHDLNKLELYASLRRLNTKQVETTKEFVGYLLYKSEKK